MTVRVPKKVDKSIVKPENPSISEKSSTKSSGSETSKTSKTPKSSAKNTRRRKFNTKVASFTQNDKKEDKTTKVILKTSDDVKEHQKDLSSLTYSVMSNLQLAIILYTFFAFNYQAFFGEPEIWKQFLVFFLAEGLLDCSMFFQHPKLGLNTQFNVCGIVTMQYFCLFAYFSSFLQSDDDSHKHLIARIFGVPAVTLFSSAIHFFIVVQSIEFLGECKNGIRDFSDEIIVEGVEEHDSKMGMMIKELVDEIVREDPNLRVYFSITDETGRAKSISGTNIDAEVTRKLEMTSYEDTIELTRTTDTNTCVDAFKDEENEKEKQVEKPPINQLLDTVGVSSKYNSCSKQAKPLSPRKIL